MGDHAVAARPGLAVVDDSEEFRNFVRAVAEQVGWAVSGFGSGRTFVASLAGLPPDRVLLDIVMPDMDGIETIGRMADAGLRCPVVLVSGREPLFSHSARQLGQARGLEIAEVLQKPVGLQKLRSALALDLAFQGC